MPAVSATSKHGPTQPTEADAGVADAGDLDEHIPPPETDELGEYVDRAKLYEAVPGGLNVTVDGVLFHVSVELERVEYGWAVLVKVKAESLGGVTRYLKEPITGPLVFVSQVTEGKHVETIGSEGIDGADALAIEPGKPVWFEREWDHVLSGGQELLLRVALWGLGRKKTEFHDLTRFVLVKVVAPKGRPAKASVNPP
ncbi:MAG: hypothetical protein R3B07_10215 [Polyangiaceae bacterium]